MINQLDNTLLLKSLNNQNIQNKQPIKQREKGETNQMIQIYHNIIQKKKKVNKNSRFILVVCEDK